MMCAVAMGDVNSNPRRWTDRSTKVRVIEGWHPSRPDRIGYNLLIDGAWIGAFDSLDGAAREAGRASSRAAGREPCDVTLIPLVDPARRRRGSV
jgi:hypothetical protein